MKYRNVTIRGARDEDLDELFRWLEKDYSTLGEGFWPNRGMICRAIDEGDFYVATVRGSVVGFQLGETNIDLIQVKRECRNRGVASRLLDRVLQRAAAAGKNLVFAGALDAAFWARNGFQESVGDPRGGKILMALHIPTWQRSRIGLSS